MKLFKEDLAVQVGKILDQALPAPRDMCVITLHPHNLHHLVDIELEFAKCVSFA